MNTKITIYSRILFIPEFRYEFKANEIYGFQNISFQSAIFITESSRSIWAIKLR